MSWWGQFSFRVSHEVAFRWWLGLESSKALTLTFMMVSGWELSWGDNQSTYMCHVPVVWASDSMGLLLRRGIRSEESVPRDQAEALRRLKTYPRNVASVTFKKLLRPALDSRGGELDSIFECDEHMYREISHWGGYHGDYLAQRLYHFCVLNSFIAPQWVGDEVQAFSNTTDRLSRVCNTCFSNIFPFHSQPPTIVVCKSLHPTSAIDLNGYSLLWSTLKSLPILSLGQLLLYPLRLLRHEAHLKSQLGWGEPLLWAPIAPWVHLS